MFSQCSPHRADLLDHPNIMDEVAGSLWVFNKIQYAEVGTWSVISIALRYVFALSINALTVSKSVIASLIYRSWHIGAVIASYSYCYMLIDQRYCFYSLLLFCYYGPAFHFSSSFQWRTKSEARSKICFLKNSLLICVVYTIKQDIQLKSRRLALPR